MNGKNILVIDNDKTLLEEAKSLNYKYVIHEPNFLSITNFPRYENVISDILKFFFDTNEVHKMYDLWLKSLIECYQNKILKNTNEAVFNRNDPISVESIDRELSTINNKRIDIFIDSDKYVVVIENKIDSGVNNPFKDYKDKAMSILNDGDKNRKIIYILLTINKEDSYDDFINITYEDLFINVRNNVGNYMYNCSEKWLVYMNEFMKNIENIKDDNIMNIDNELQKFLQTNENGISHLLNILIQDVNSKIEFFKEVYNEIKNLSNSKYENGPYNLNYNKLGGYFSVWVNVKKDNEVLAIEPYIIRNESEKIKFEIWKRLGDRNYRWNDEIIKLKSKYPNCKVVEDGEWGKVLLLDEKHFFENSFTPKSFAKEILDIAEIIGI